MALRVCVVQVFPGNEIPRALWFCGFVKTTTKINSSGKIRTLIHEIYSQLPKIWEFFDVSINERTEIAVCVCVTAFEHILPKKNFCGCDVGASLICEE